MSQSLSDYFALEAGDYLEQLDRLLSRGSPPDLEQVYRLARGVRGSAQVAQLAGIARVAEPLEQAARAGIVGGGWTEPVRAHAVRTVDDLKVLVRGARSWGNAEDERVRSALLRWREVSPAPQRAEPSAAPTLNDRLFPFVRDEIAAVVAELDAAVHDLERDAGDLEPLKRVLQRMRAVRGVRGAQSLAPLMEVLEGVEDLTRSVAAHSLTVDGGRMDLLAAARAALRAAIAPLARGEPPLRHAPELSAFRFLRDGAKPVTESDSDVVPIAELFYDDGGPHVVSSPLAPVPETGIDEATPPAVLDFLRMEATSFLDRAEASLAETHAAAPYKLARVSARLADLALAVRELAVTYHLDTVRDAATRAADDIRGAEDEAEVRSALALLRQALPGAPAAPQDATTPEPPEAAPAPSSTEAALAASVPEARGTEPDADVVPIETLLLRGPRALRAALELRPQLAAAASGAADPRLTTLVGEVFDLVELGLEPTSVA